MSARETVFVERAGIPTLIYKDEMREGETVCDEEGTEEKPNEGTVAWYEMQLTEMEVDFSDCENKADLVELYELNLTDPE